MTNTAQNFDHAALNIPGITLPGDPIEAERVLIAQAQAARQSAGATIPHATVMLEMRSRINRAAQRGATSAA